LRFLKMDLEDGLRGALRPCTSGEEKGSRDMNQTLVGDLGGTNTRFAIAVAGETGLRHVKQFRNAEFPDFDDVLSHYLSEIDAPTLSGVCIAAAGPVAQGELRMTNISWVLSEAGLRERLGAGTALLINDLQAFAYALEVLGADDLVPVCNADAPLLPMGQKLVVNLGTGFNVSVTTKSVGGKVLALRSEIGHASMPSLIHGALAAHLPAEDVAELTTYEHLFCGRGLEWLYRKLAGAGAASRAGKDIVEAAMGDTPDATCRRTVETYSEMMGLLCADLVKQFLPTGGIYLTGSVATMLRHADLAERFYDRFQSAPSLPNLPKRIRCALINDPFAALKGCAFLIGSEV
jgi:glucokinase